MKTVIEKGRLISRKRENRLISLEKSVIKMSEIRAAACEITTFQNLGFILGNPIRNSS
jgi:hypothetical protein